MDGLIHDPSFNILYPIQGNRVRQIASNLSSVPSGYTGNNIRRLIYFVPQILSDPETTEVDGLLFGKSATSTEDPIPAPGPYATRTICILRRRKHTKNRCYKLYLQNWVFAIRTRRILKLFGDGSILSHLFLRLPIRYGVLLQVFKKNCSAEIFYDLWEF